MLAKTQAVVLKSMKFRDTSKIVTFYTRDYGKLKAVAKGARDTKSKFGAALEPMTHVGLVIYKKQNRDLQLISQCDILSFYKRIHSEIQRMSTALTMVELMDRVTHHEEENAGLFSLIIDCLEALEKSEGNFQLLLPVFELRMASQLGYAPSLEKCANCGKALQTFDPKDLGMFQVTKGAVLCPICLERPSETGMLGDVRFQGGRKASMKTLNVLRMFLEERLDSIPSIEYDEVTGNEIDETLRLYLRHHFEDLRLLKSTEIFQKLLV